MRYHVLACDYDGTIAHDGRVDGPTLAALNRLVDSGRKLVLVTGRQLDELLSIFPDIGLFHRVVAENGALVYHPQTEKEQILAERPDEGFVRTLRDRGVAPLAIGRVIVATWQPHEVAVLRTIRDLGLELQVIFNKGAVMILPGGVTKATGLKVALRDLQLSRHNTVGVGDAENDHAFLGICQCSAAVANALPALCERADIVTRGDHGAGVTELIEGILSNDLWDVTRTISRHDLLMGHLSDGSELRLSPTAGSILFAGDSSRAAANAYMRCLGHAEYQVCLLGSLGADLERSITIGAQRAPSFEEVQNVLVDPERNATVELASIPSEERPAFAAALVRGLREFRKKAGRPHWIVINDFERLWPASALPESLFEVHPSVPMAFLSANPAAASAHVLSRFETAIMSDPETVRLLGGSPSGQGPKSGEPGDGSHVWYWKRGMAVPLRARLREATDPAYCGLAEPHP
jgi:HAD superfamily hydrolase (TIGR01484 family)